MTDKLKSCPFCGGEAELAIVKLWNHVYCKNCHSRTTMYSSEEQAIEAWNNRPSPWHTGMPAEDGDYVVETWTGKHTVLTFKNGWWWISDEVPVPKDAIDYIKAYGQKVEPYKETE